MVDYAVYRLLWNLLGPAGPRKIPEAVQTPLCIPPEPVAHSFSVWGRAMGYVSIVVAVVGFVGFIIVGIKY